MAIKERASAKWTELKQKLQDKENQRRVKEEIAKRLTQGKEAIHRIERDLRDPETRARVENKLRDAKARAVRVKETFKKKEREAMAYTKESPEKALVVAAAAGALAGALWVAFRRKK
jgi:hypothetical protein